MMIDEKLLLLKEIMSEYAIEFRKIGLIIDENPESIYQYINLDIIRNISRMNIPKEFNDKPLEILNYEYYGDTCLERVVAIEQLAYGDLGVLLACPGPSLSGQVINDFGDKKQKEYYYNKLLNKPTWTFFALSEPTKGSDASNVETRVVFNQEKNKYSLNGEKYFVGNGCRGDIGIVFAKRNSEPLSMKIVLIDREKNKFTSEKIDSMGVRGVELSSLVFKNCEVDEWQLLGEHLSSAKRGIWGAITTFNKMRPGIAAMGLGLSQAVVDYVKCQFKQMPINSKNKIERLEYLINSLRNLVYQTAAKIDQDPIKNGYFSSISKLQSIQITNQVINEAIDILGVNSMYDHPFLEKAYRDSRAIEYMEGTSNIQKLNIFQSYTKGRYQIG
ncbi:acyl-CoA dehydrogenase family protein [Parageobacillus thermoglucosidasius]|uniref:Acyl-CoA dehydrogenase family protein n=1 Tax=Parageobacillus thermoglucosidasius TaxID=1426 RepID=A0AB38R1H2_PARTM|nr:acyl-CoA dehydrogenase family protein [Parageobacillus thermoglucosidasius]UOE77554.1 acyl-CoA dehydrogenase family protein [Parageobacillus thermoglucosidasius]